MSSTRPIMTAGPMERNSKGFRMGSVDSFSFGGAGVSAGVCAHSQPAIERQATPAKTTAARWRWILLRWIFLRGIVDAILLAPESLVEEAWLNGVVNRGERVLSYYDTAAESFERLVQNGVRRTLCAFAPIDARTAPSPTVNLHSVARTWQVEGLPHLDCRDAETDD